jgi:6-pyruvoyltetrahydropterin/6-carboxytetrahydropterin synthase
MEVGKMLRKIIRLSLFSVMLGAFFALLACVHMGWQIPYIGGQFNSIYAGLLIALYTIATITGINQFGFMWGIGSSAIMAVALLAELVVNDQFQTYGLALSGLMSIIAAISWVVERTARIWSRMLQSSNTLERQAERLGNQLTERKHTEETLALWEWKLNAIIQVMEESRRKGLIMGDSRATNSALSEFVSMLKTINTEAPQPDAEKVEAPQGEYITLSITPVREQVLVEMFNRNLEELTGVTRCILAGYAGDMATYHVFGPTADDLALALMTIPSFRGHSIRVLNKQVTVTLRVTATDAALSRPESAAPAPAVARDEIGMAVETAAYQLGVDVFFNARHFVTSGDNPGPMHQHSWRVQVNVTGNYLNENGMLIGFAEAKQAAQAEATRLNGVILNEIEAFSQMQPTTENVARVLYREIKISLGSLPIRLASVCVWESPTSHIIYKGNEETTPQAPATSS